jgi:hypothetical protein
MPTATDAQLAEAQTNLEDYLKVLLRVAVRLEREKRGIP